MQNRPEITAVVYGETQLPESMVFPGGSEQVFYPIKLVIYTVKTEHHLVLVDAGCNAMPGFTLRSFRSPADALKDAGIDPDAVTDVIITHAHHDHIEGIHHFPRAAVYIQEEEYALGKQWIPPELPVHTFRDRCVVAGCLEMCRIGGHSPGSSIIKLKRGTEQFVFAGDECYLRATLEGKLPVGGYRPGVCQQFIETYGNGQHRVLLAHDPEVVTGPIE